MVTTTASLAVASQAQSKAPYLILAVIVGVGLFLLPIAGISRPAHTILAILAFTVVLWATQTMNSGVASVLMMALMIAARIRAPLVLSGFGSPPFWVLLTVLFYGYAMNKTGLAERVAYYILSMFPGTYAGILSAFFVIGFLLAFGIPSMTVRTAIMTPIAWALVQSLGLPSRSRGAALIVLTTIEMAVIPGIAFLYGSLSGPIVDASFQAKHLPLSWLGYAQVLTVPTLLLCGLILLGNPILLRPESPLHASPTFARERLSTLGSVRRPEMITAIVVVISIAYWATDRLHHLPSFLVGMIAVAVFSITGLLPDEDIGTGVSWPLLLYLGGVFGLANVIQEYRITDWLASFFIPIASHLTFSVLVVVVVMALAMFLLRFLDPSSFIAISVLFLSVVDVTRAAGIPPLVLMAPIILASVPFWVSYQNFWVAMGEGIASFQAFSGRQRVRLASGYAVLTLVALAVSIAYWKLIGVLQ